MLYGAVILAGGVWLVRSSSQPDDDSERATYEGGVGFWQIPLVVFPNIPYGYVTWKVFSREADGAFSEIFSSFIDGKNEMRKLRDDLHRWEILPQLIRDVPTLVVPPKPIEFFSPLRSLAKAVGFLDEIKIKFPRPLKDLVSESRFYA